MPLPTELFDYELPPRLIAQTPAARRDASRLMVVDRASRKVVHTVFAELPAWLRAGDILFRNNAAVLPARLHARRPTGGAVECFLLRPDTVSDRGEAWWCLVRPGKRLPPGAVFSGGEGDFSATVLEKREDGTALVRFTTPRDASIIAVANRLGDIPLPPYISREGTEEERERDIERYQTVYADRASQVAVAAPTAGLHFTPELLARLAALGVGTADMTLHVGLGTFKPIGTETVEEHAIHREIYEMPEAAARRLVAPGGGRRIAVGTTSVRTIEDYLAKREREGAGAWQTGAGGGVQCAEAALFIYPPRRFLGVDALITNFHQPRSTLLCLVSAFLTPGSTDGIAWMRELYAEAIAREYRFFSYGDAMLVL
ncbi:tRNA preQ1(34) S-adenosylmethionine ribosyltransferase-isomerase QueA [Termitidicoccus mucosus]|uniref:S-adenosylmethionine:tRNA ribosyltransferase-isomerase n=1 Tax=Termitidicoccus mucosus TaxID=1184151 RepID=A0A178ILH4_9BACT|nr:S-adenosylmethionine:tRNA ribosyltransferase-isomerase [Opitutaceae bacterium TSB47]